MRIILLNKNNLVPNNSAKNTFRYVFQNSQTFTQNQKIGLLELIIPFSWFNISTQFNNNKFSYRWIDGIVYHVNIPNSHMNIFQINDFLQFTMIGNGHYLVDNNGRFVYYLEMIYNEPRYSVQLNCYAFPTSLPSGWSNPNNIVFPTQAITPQFIFDQTNFKDLIGFDSGEYPAIIQTSNQSFLSTKTPNGSPINSILINCSIADNQTTPQNLIYTFTSTGSRYGTNISINPPQIAFVDIRPGNYSFMDISFQDDNFNALFLNDVNLTMLLAIE
jgi:hypothetical protein